MPSISLISFGLYSYGLQANGTLKCRDDASGSAGNFNYNETEIVLYGNQSFAGNVHMKTGFGQTGLSLENLNGAPYWTFVHGIFGLFNASLCTAPCAFGSSSLTEAFTFDGLGNLAYLGNLQGSSATITTLTSTTHLNTNQRTSNNLSVSQNLSVGDWTTTKFLNVSTNATIPHFNVNATTFALSTNYTNNNGKAIRVDLGVQTSYSVISSDVAYILIILNPYDVTAPKYVQRCGSENYNRILHNEYHICTFDVPVAYNYTAYPVITNSGLVNLREVHITDN